MRGDDVQAARTVKVWPRGVPQIAVPCQCPVCGYRFTVTCDPGALAIYQECIAVAAPANRKCRKPVYLRTCEVHGLADVFTLIHDRGAR